MIAALILLLAATSSAHTVITYPGWRGDNLHTNGTYADESIIPGSIGVNWDEKKEKYTFPYGMQWIYPCGGMPTTTNRTKWPVSGGAIAVQPGWFQGHQTAFFYVNMGLGNEPLNYSHPVVPVFQILGPSNDAYPGTFCLPQVPMPANLTFNPGDNLTLQVVETAVHGAALYSCVDVTLAADDDPDIARVTEDNCFNSTKKKSKLGFNLVFASSSLSSDAQPTLLPSSIFTLVPLVAAFVASFAWL